MIKIANGAVTIERSGEKHPATPGARIEAGLFLRRGRVAFSE